VVLTAGGDPLVAEISASAEDRGWLVIGRRRIGTPRPLVTAVLAEARRARLGTMVLPLGGADLATMAGWIELATSHLREDLVDERPIAYLGAGLGAAAGWVAAGGGDLDGVMAWNPRLSHAWANLPAVSAPSLLVVDGDDWWRLLVTRAACWRLGGPADVVTRGGHPFGAWAPPGAPPDETVLTAWFERRLLSAPAPVHGPRRAPGIRRAGVASLAAVAALTAGPLSVPAASAIPDFSSGLRLSSTSIGGDSAKSQALPTTTTTRNEKAKTLKAGQIGGDGARSLPITDGIGLRWNVNTNVGFITTSSASGAVSEANFTHAVAASTLNGGSVNQFLGDAFDGYNALCLDLNNVGGQCNTANMAVYNQNGPASLECSGRQAVLPLKTMGNFQVRRKVFTPSNDSFTRWLNIVRNTSATTQTVRLQTSNNLGSDANTRIVTTSDGDATPELTDTWVTTFQNYTGTTSSDPRGGPVLRGVGGVVGLAANNFVNGDDNPFWRYQFTLGPGQTAIIMNFATGQANKAAAAAQAAALANLTNPNALACMTPAEIGQVLNFKTDSTPPVCAILGVFAGPPKRMEVSIKDLDSGLALAAVTNVKVSNGTVTVAPFVAGTTDPVIVTGTKDNQDFPTVWSFDLTDVQGNTVHCT
jgi:hypothetical protein